MEKIKLMIFIINGAGMLLGLILLYVTSNIGHLGSIIFHGFLLNYFKEF